MANVDPSGFYRAVINQMQHGDPYLRLHPLDGGEINVKCSEIAFYRSIDRRTEVFLRGVDCYIPVKESYDDIKLMLKIAGHLVIGKDRNGEITYEE